MSLVCGTLLGKETLVILLTNRFLKIYLLVAI